MPFTQDPAGWASHLFLPWIVLAVVSIGFYCAGGAQLAAGHAAPGLRAHRPRQGPLASGGCSTRHTLRTCLIPVVTLFGLDFGAAVGGTVILIEPIFGLEGVGQYAQESVTHLDLPPLMALTLYGAFFVVILQHARGRGLPVARPAQPNLVGGVSMQKPHH